MILDQIVIDKKARLIECKEQVSESEMKARALASRRNSLSFYQALSKRGLSIIGEFKNASPSMGVIDNPIDLSDRITQYNQSVDAISCLTEETHFLGSVDYFKQVRAISTVPMIRKDFIIDPYQIYEAKVIEADCILLIAAILDDEQLLAYYQLAYELGMDVLVEVHDEQEMERSLKINPKMIGVNNRDLNDFSVSLETTKRLRKMAGNDTIFVSESGITTISDIEFLKACNIDAILVGGAFMQSDSPRDMATEWKHVYEN